MSKAQRISNLPNAPAFSAYKASDQTITTSTFTKVTFGTEDYDTAACFASSRFTPTTAGYYNISAAIDISNGISGLTRQILSVYKNGSTYKRLHDEAASTVYTLSGSCDVYLNGTTDYVEVFAYITATTPTITGGSEYTWFQGHLVRPA